MADTILVFIFWFSFFFFRLKDCAEAGGLRKALQISWMIVCF